MKMREKLFEKSFSRTLFKNLEQKEKRSPEFSASVFLIVRFLGEGAG